MPARSRSRVELPPLIVAVTGASGAPYAVRLLECVVRAERTVWLIVSAHGWRLLATESGVADARALRRRVGAARWDAHVRMFDDSDRGASPASGSTRTAGMIICPCSMGTVAAIAHGTSRSLIERTADVTLKERRPLIVVPRETPLSAIHLENLLRLSRAGGVILPAAPGYYHRPAAISDLVDFVVARVLDHAGVPHGIGQRWSDVEPNEQ